MNRLLARSFVLPLLLPGAVAQNLGVRQELTAHRSAGTFHVATGRWTRGAQGQAYLGPDVIYRNDAPSGYFGMGFENCVAVHQIVLPGTDHPRKGPADAYLVDGFSFEYCKAGAGTLEWRFEFYDSYVPFTDPTDPSTCFNEVPRPVVIPGLPGGTACWTVTVDLSGGYEVCLQASGGPCNPGYQGGDLDHGGIGAVYHTSDGGNAGPVLSGDPTWVPLGEGTCYDSTYTGTCGSVSTGLGALDTVFISHKGLFGCQIGSGSYFFGGYTNHTPCAPSNIPIAQGSLVLYTDCSATCIPGDRVYCEESQNPNNAADVSISTTDSGAASIFVGLAAGPPNEFCYLLVGDGDKTVSMPPGSAGDLCVAGGTCLGRYDKDAGKILSDGTFATDIQNALSAPCAGGVLIAPGESWNFQWWHRRPMGQPSTFSSAIRVTFD